MNSYLVQHIMLVVLLAIGLVSQPSRLNAQTRQQFPSKGSPRPIHGQQGEQSVPGSQLVGTWRTSNHTETFRPDGTIEINFPGRQPSTRSYRYDPQRQVLLVTEPDGRITRVPLRWEGPNRFVQLRYETDQGVIPLPNGGRIFEKVEPNGGDVDPSEKGRFGSVAPLGGPSAAFPMRMNQRRYQSMPAKGGYR